MAVAVAAAHDHAWTCGFATALAEMHRRLLHGNGSKDVAAVLYSAGLTMRDLVDAGVATFDLHEIQKAIASDG